MATHNLELKLKLPDEILTLDEVRLIAKQAGLSLDDYVSRCIVSWSRMEAKHHSDPEVATYYNAHKSLGPIDLSPRPRANPGT